ncbi:hypothetical protein MKX34_17185 [Paenibacillus sp. FSL R5-0636]|uniref:hypothetical protein n=1 Tax=Paenibacillus TaxID=44249 RepID=UPI00096F2EEF|nr:MULTISPECIES: hypothetical protein [Paenibacillus]MDH6427275.1 hypothetical protein [Paenibacillus sp. PastH-4]MDH6525991.1 hypothetical protein [Paenibacillus sp. PastH-3]OMD03483.1 hypothetical protein BJP49_01320 [Paenibacillus odorifer]OME18765.1 hypothetical protein BSK60_01625 [Paenibacillus odorifer]OME62295.1 hypothetical protein BSK59_02155 [Paenibacillus odorifer]
MRCCTVLDKTQWQIENEYFFVDLPQLLLLKDQAHASNVIEQLEIESYPHITDKKVREQIINRYIQALPKAPEKPKMSAEDQYQAQLVRMKGGG